VDSIDISPWVRTRRTGALSRPPSADRSGVGGSTSAQGEYTPLCICPKPQRSQWIVDLKDVLLICIYIRPNCLASQTCGRVGVSALMPTLRIIQPPLPRCGTSRQLAPHLGHAVRGNSAHPITKGRKCRNSTGWTLRQCAQRMSPAGRCPRAVLSLADRRATSVCPGVVDLACFDASRRGALRKP
jgi:hypothetical protein